MAQEIRQAINGADISAIVLEHKLGEGKGDSGKYINGSLVLKAGEFAEITLKVFVGEKNKNGKVKKSYEALQKILKGEYKTMAEVPEAEAVKVRVWGKDNFTPHFKEEIYKPEGATEVSTIITMDLGFGNIVIDNNIKPEDYEAKFDVEMFVESITEEIDKSTEEETGRVVVKGWTPVYGGTVIPLAVTVGFVEDEDGEFDFAEVIRTDIEVGMTVNFWGDIDYRKIVEKTSKGGGMGKAKVDKKTTYIHDLVAVGAEIVEGENEYQENDIKQALVERASKIKEKETETDSNAKPQRGAARAGVAGSGSARTGVGARSSRPSSTKPSQKPSNDDDDLPF